MTCSPSQSAPCSPSSVGRERFRTQALELLRSLDLDLPADDLPPEQADAALATALMDAYRRTRDPLAFDGLVRWVSPQLRARLRSRLRRLRVGLDPDEVLQDTFVNIYRYPDRFQASRPGAFAAWSTTIADNAIRRQLRRTKRDQSVTLRDPEVLQASADVSAAEPSRQAESQEECAATASAMGVVLGAYLACYRELSERERFVLQMVEVKKTRYAELAGVLGIRPEALKMVVFRARKRLFERLGRALSPAAGPAPLVSVA